MTEPIAYSHFAGGDVSTWSGEWRHECEVKAVLAMKTDDCRPLLEGRTDPYQTGVV